MTVQRPSDNFFRKWGLWIFFGCGIIFSMRIIDIQFLFQHPILDCTYEPFRHIIHVTVNNQVMPQPFTFPPPPPPPPKPVSNTASYQTPPVRGGGYRGRGNSSNFQHNNRGGGYRGQSSSRGSQRGAYGGRGSVNNYSGNRPAYSDSKRTTNFTTNTANESQNGQFNPAQKRPHSTAFSGQVAEYAPRHRPSAPPAVPSFGVDFNALLPKKPEPSKVAPVSLPKKVNILGLTPGKPTSDTESEDDDEEEEESKLATSFTNQNILEFEYRGETSALKTPEEIAAWIAERRKRWPTEAKREVAQKEAAERKAKFEAEKAARIEASKAAAKARQEERQKQKLEREKSQVRQRLLQEQIRKASLKAKSVDPNVTQSAVQIKAERLRRKAQKVAQQLKIAEMALEKQDHDASTDKATDVQTSSNSDGEHHDIDALLEQVDRIAAAQEGQGKGPESINHSDIDASDLDPETVPNLPDDETSSSGTSDPSDTDPDSDSDSDSPPEQLSTKQSQSSSKIPAPPQNQNDTRPLCTNYARTGRCKFGKRCHFRHQKPDRKDTGGSGVGKSGNDGKRKGLYQIMVEKEQEVERRRALKVIIALGDAGVLDEKGPTEGGETV